MKRLAFLLVLGACGKADETKGREETAPKPVGLDARSATDPACASKAKELEPWLAQLNLEERTFEVDFVYELVVIGRGPAGVEQQIDNVFITPTRIEAFDETEANRAETKLGERPAQQAVVQRLAAIKAMGQGVRLRVDVDQAATWGDVARAVEAAAAAGYEEALFAFTATSKLEPPPGVEPYTTTMEAFDEAGARLEALGATCKGLGKYSSDAAGVSEALVGCHCAADPDEVRALLWKRSRWHQARPRVGVVVALGEGTVVEQPKATPWSEAHTRLLELAPDGAPPPAVKLVAR
jgi:hypothetical protein